MIVIANKIEQIEIDPFVQEYRTRGPNMENTKCY